MSCLLCYFLFSQTERERSYLLRRNRETKCRLGKAFYASQERLLKAFYPQVLKDHLSDCLRRANLTSVSGSEASSWGSLKVEGRLSRVCDAFCAAYGDEDRLQMECFAVFLKDICKEQQNVEVEAQTLHSLLQQVLLVADYSEGT